MHTPLTLSRQPALLVAFLLAFTLPAQAQTTRTVSIDFVGSGTALGATETAGVVAKSNWNNAIGTTRNTPLALVDETGSASGIGITWNTGNVGRTPITDQAGNRRMMRGFLDARSSATTVVTVSGLAAQSYDVYLYVDGDNGAATRTGAYTISGAGMAARTINATDPAGTNYDAAFTQANNSTGNYVKFSVTAAGFTLTAVPGAASDGTGRAPLNAMQIVPVAVVTPPPPAAGSVVSIDFVGSGTAIGATESAGVIPRTNWNNAVGAARSTPLSLRDETGAASGAAVTWSSNNVWMTPIADQAGNRRLMKGYLDTTATSTTTVTVTGLAAGAYDVYLYADGDNGSAARSAGYRISGTGFAATTINLTDAAGTNFNAALTQANNSAGNYVKFSVNATGFTLTATPGSATDGNKRAPVNAIQIVPTAVAPPVGFTLAGVVSPATAGGAVTVNLGGTAAATTVTDASGNFSFTAVPNGNYTVMPGKAGYTFSPSSRTVTVNGADVTGIAFTADPAAPTYSISGTIVPAASAAGAAVQLTGPSSATVVADSSGSYVFTGLLNGTYTVTPGKSGYAFGPASRGVVVADANATGVNFTVLAPDKTRANSYDNAWKTAWVSHARSLLAAGGKTDGFVIELGDSITHAHPYASWPIQGDGKTTEDVQVLTWARAAPWAGSNTNTASKNGWYLAAADTTAARGMTAAGGESIAEFLTGCCNGGPAMPATTDPVPARQVIANPTYTGNMQVDTLAAAFGDAQFAVVMLGTNDVTNPDNLTQLNSILDKLEGRRILPILSTIPPRNDGTPDDFTIQFNAGLRDLARTRSLPLIDFYQEILLRRPGLSWIGTLISSDGVHPTGTGAGFSSTSNPYASGGNAATHLTGDALANVGYLLRSWLTVQKLKEVKQYVVDGIEP